MFIVLQKAEVESLENNPNALKSYDTAAQLAIEYEWLMEEGWCHYLVSLLLPGSLMCIDELVGRMSFHSLGCAAPRR